MADGLKEKILAAIEGKTLTKRDAQSLAKALKSAIKDLGPEDGEEPDEEDEDLPILQTLQESVAALGKRIALMEKAAKDGARPPKSPSIFDIIFGEKK